MNMLGVPKYTVNIAPEFCPCCCKLGPKGVPTPLYSSPPKGQKTERPLGRTALLLPLLLLPLLLLLLTLLPILVLQSRK
jgi:hypothetical protein